MRDEASLDISRLGCGALERDLPRPAVDAAFEPDQRAPQIDLLLGPAVAGLDQAATNIPLQVDTEGVVIVVGGMGR